MELDVGALVAEIKQHPRIADAGMILTHLGMVRSFSLTGGNVTRLEVNHDMQAAERIRLELLARPGIVDIRFKLNNGILSPGETIMVAAVAGATRDKVFPVLEELINRLKKEASQKKEYKD